MFHFQSEPYPSFRLNVDFPGIDTESCKDGGHLGTEEKSAIQEYLSVIAKLMSNSEVHSIVLSFFDDGSASIINNLKIASLESRLQKTSLLCHELNSRLCASEKNFSQISDLVAMLKFKLENIESGNKSIQRYDYFLVNSVVIPMILKLTFSSVLQGQLCFDYHGI